MANYVKYFGRALTAAANTQFAVTVKAEDKLVPRIVNLGYVAGNTVHTVTLFRPVGTTTTAANFSANGTSLTLTADPSAAYNSSTWGQSGYSGLRPGVGAVSAMTASNSVTTYGILQCDNGEYCLLACTAFNATSGVATITAGATATPAYAATSGNKFWYCGAAADLNNMPLNPQANSRTQYNPGNNVGIFGSNFHGDPIAVLSSNGTAAGYLDVSGGYVKIAGG